MTTQSSWAALLLGLLTFHAVGESTAQIPESITTPDEVQSPIGVLEFKDGAPTVETARRVKDHLTLVRALNVYNNSFRGASALGLAKGFESIGAGDNSVIIYSKLMDSNSLFLTANCDTVYYIHVSRESNTGTDGHRATACGAWHDQ